MSRILSSILRFLTNVDFNYRLTSLSILPDSIFNRFNSGNNMDTKEELKQLSERLARAENQVTKLVHEITVIKCMMCKLQKNSGFTKTTVKSNIREYSTNTIKLIDEVDDSDEAGRPAKRSKKDFGSQDFSYEGDFVVVYTDGACENNGRAGAKAGLGVWFGPDHPLNISAPVTGKATNNVGEIQACIRALKTAQENNIRKLCIKTDSQFVISSMTSWIKKWKKNNWKLSTGGDVKNKVDFVILDQCCTKMDEVKWVHVAGHKGIVGNEAADQLARNGALLYVP